MRLAITLLLSTITGTAASPITNITTPWNGWTASFVKYHGAAPVSNRNGPYLLDDPDRQFLHIQEAPAAACAAAGCGVFFFAHGNSASADMNWNEREAIASANYSTISWESITAVQSEDDLLQAMGDFELVIAWVRANAETYNLDTSNFIIGGRSRGSLISFAQAQGMKPGPIDDNGQVTFVPAANPANPRAIYMYNALPNHEWPPTLVTADSPPLFFAYGPWCAKPIEDTCESWDPRDDPPTSDMHNPKYGQNVVDAYVAAGVAVTLKDGLHYCFDASNKTLSTNPHLYFPDFVASLDAGSALDERAVGACDGIEHCVDDDLRIDEIAENRGATWVTGCEDVKPACDWDGSDGDMVRYLCCATCAAETTEIEGTVALAGVALAGGEVTDAMRGDLGGAIKATIEAEEVTVTAVDATENRRGRRRLGDTTYTLSVRYTASYRGTAAAKKALSKTSDPASAAALLRRLMKTGAFEGQSAVKATLAKAARRYARGSWSTLDADAQDQSQSEEAQSGEAEAASKDTSEDESEEELSHTVTSVAAVHRGLPQSAALLLLCAGFVLSCH